MNIILEIILFILFFIIIGLFIEAHSVNKEIKLLCPNYDVVRGSVWHNKVVCYNETIVNDTYTKIGYVEKLRGAS